MKHIAIHLCFPTQVFSAGTHSSRCSSCLNSTVQTGYQESLLLFDLVFILAKNSRVNVWYSKTTLKLAWEWTTQGMYKHTQIWAGIQLWLGTGKLNVPELITYLGIQIDFTNLIWFSPIYSVVKSVVTHTRVRVECQKNKEFANWTHMTAQKDYKERRETWSWDCGEKSTCLSSNNSL